jgi:hypothetical protein
MGETMQNVQSADHFRNLFEVPVLFYALCAFLASTIVLYVMWGIFAVRLVMS